MSRMAPNRRLSSLDAFFVYHERRQSPFNLGGVSIFDGEIPAGELLGTLSRRIGQVPRYRQRLMSEILNLGHPRWEDDPDFDLARHIIETRIEPPGTEDQLRRLAGVVMSGQLRRDRPLWDLTLVQGIEGGRSALIIRIHHCLVDGVAGVDLMSILLDLRAGRAERAAPPDPPPPEPIEPTEPTEEVADQRELPRRILDAVLGGAQEIVDRALDVNDILLDLAEMALFADSRPVPTALAGEAGAGIPRLLIPAERLPFNAPLSDDKGFDWLRLPLATARAIRSSLKGSVNDVILTVLADAVSRYILERGESVAGRRLRVMVPVNVRPNRHLGTAGNSISFLPVELALDREDPLALFADVNRQTARMKLGRMAEVVNLLIAAYGIIPAPIQALAGALAGGAVSDQIRPFNIISTNVPGPEAPLYVIGRKLIAHYPYVPIAYSMGLGLATLSYNQDLCLGLTSDRQVFPDAGRMRELLVGSFDRLRQSAGVGGAPSVGQQEGGSDAAAGP